MSRIKSLITLSLYHKPWPVSSAIAPRLDTTHLAEEEKIPDYHPDRFYPARLGQILNQRYQLATKLGYGANSTVWLARDLRRWRWSKEKYVAVKLNATATPSRQLPTDNEERILRHISKLNPHHQGWHFIRKLSDSFQLEGVYGGKHSCLILDALREPLWIYQQRYIDGFIPVGILKILLQMTLQALDYLHSECHVIHADLKPDNIMIRIEDPSIFEEHALDEFHHPLPQKHTGDRVIYLSRNNYGPLKRPTGIIQLMDFDLSVSTKPGRLHYGAIQAEIYRAPEVILEAGYTFSADIWSLGVLFWDLLEGKHLFNPHTPEKPDEYDEAPPRSLVSSGRRSSMFYDDNNPETPRDPQPLACNLSFEEGINQIKGEEKRRFISFVKRMIKWKPEERSTAKELLGDPWLYEDFSQDQAKDKSPPRCLNES
ncbi:unnamed protein product [Clonostachys byssicola]|uniref:non-specific serine/threonine protein kinase n=1 Tax=Clonostachys byssicola TaxID=160290 RepID=A0A9N9U201_9HYPO|nr:unnamed protein product [Clonostachys byssicola]